MKVRLGWVLLILAGCSTTNPQLLAALAPAANIGTEVNCQAPCKEEWERAQLWIVKRARWKIQTVTDVVIQTYNPLQYDPSYGFTVIREPSGGYYTIRLQLSCGNMYGCSPQPLHVQQAFLYYVKTGEDLLAQVESPGHGIRR